MAGWHYIEQGQQCGPLTDDELRERVAAGALRPEDYVWTEGMADWAPASQIQGLQWPGHSTPPPPVPPPPPPPPQAAAPAPGGSPTGDLNLPRGGLSPVSPQEIERSQAAPIPVPNHLVASILVSLFCCMPLTGIVAILYSILSLSAKNSGDHAKALRYASTAWKWVLATIFISLTILALLQFSNI